MLGYFDNFLVASPFYTPPKHLEIVMLQLQIELLSCNISHLAVGTKNA